MIISFEPNRDLSEPVYIQLSTTISAAIDSGKLKAGLALPPSRELATSLGLSRDTVISAYKELTRLAYISGDSTKGTYILPRDVSQKDPKDAARKRISDDRLSTFGRQMVNELFKHPSTPSFAALNYGAVPRSELPMRRWREMMQQLCVPETFRKLEYEPNVLGRQELRKAIADYLLRTKNIECNWQQVAIFSLSSGIVNVLCRLLLEPGEVVAVEEPGYGAVKNIAKSQGLVVLPVEVDEQGVSVTALKNYPGKISLIYVTASHHDPSGIIMSTARRKELLAWAESNGVWIVDDDYDGHFYYAGDPPPTLWSLSPESNVIYSATFWQVLYPLTTVGYTVVPESLIPVMSAVKELQTEGISDFMVQLTLSKMLDEGHLEKHLRRVRKPFARRRIALIHELKKQFGSLIDIRNESAGNYFVIYFKQWNQDEVENAALLANLPLVSTRTYYLNKPKAGEFLINFALIDEAEVVEKVSVFAKNLKTSS